MFPDIVEIKRLCVSGQWVTRIENGKILLHDTVAGETVCIGQIPDELEQVKRERDAALEDMQKLHKATPASCAWCKHFSNDAPYRCVIPMAIRKKWGQCFEWRGMNHE